MKAKWKDRVIAESDRTLDVDGYIYFPRDTVRMELLRASPRTASDDACPHGVQFYDAQLGDEISERAAWSYEKPKSALEKVDHWISFWKLEFD